MKIILVCCLLFLVGLPSLLRQVSQGGSDRVTISSRRHEFGTQLQSGASDASGAFDVQQQICIMLFLFTIKHNNNEYNDDNKKYRVVLLMLRIVH